MKTKKRSTKVIEGAHWVKLEPEIWAAVVERRKRDAGLRHARVPMQGVVATMLLEAHRAWEQGQK